LNVGATPPLDKNKSTLLDWSKRHVIITGLARGLLYLHEEGPERIIHRDIKASNILLDDQLRQKISDFGLARLFPGEDTHLNTFKISGTHGYMAPEYAMHGYLSVKSGVFSFGVLVLEIVSGRKSYDRQLGAEKANLLSYISNKTVILVVNAKFPALHLNYSNLSRPFFGSTWRHLDNIFSFLLFVPLS
ncbi:hypothetical protein GIB67_023682, partial [Kingdonia uniflora]